MEKGLNQEVIRIKGKAPKYTYTHSLPEFFYSLGDKVFSTMECLSILNAMGITIDEDGLLRTLFGYRYPDAEQRSDNMPFSFAGPFQMSFVMNSLFPYNLRYQDTVIKIELEKAEEVDNNIRTKTERNEILNRILEIVSTSLRTAFFSEKPIYLELTNMELDRLVLQCFLLFGLRKPQNQDYHKLIITGREANLIAGLVQKKILNSKRMTLDNLLPFLIFSGVVWWSDEEIIKQNKESPDKVILHLYKQLSALAQNQLVINDFPLFQAEVLDTPTEKSVLYFLDDNGELVWGLLFIRYLLDANPNLVITCVVNDIPVTNNCNTATVFHFLKTRGSFLNLLQDTRFCIFREPNELPAIDLRFISSRLKTCIEEADIILVNGVSYFEKLQYLHVPSYYLFTVYSEVSRILTGFERYSGIFVRVGPHLCGFSDIQEEDIRPKPGMSLKDIHTAVQTPAYKNFLDRFTSEAEANLLLWKRSKQERKTLKEILNHLETNG